MSHVLGIFPIPEKAALSWISLQGYFIYIIATWPILMAALSKAYVCGRSIATIAGSNPAEGVSVLSCLLCVVKVAATATR